MSYGTVPFNHPDIAEGRFRYVCKGYRKANPSEAMVVKVFKEGCPMDVSALQPHLDVYERADELARRWNRDVVPKGLGAKRIYFREPDTGYHTSSDHSGLNRWRQGQYSFREKFLDGHYQKFNSNAGREEGWLTADTFTHWTYEVTGHKYMVCDLQGVFKTYGAGGDGHHFLLTDPCVHSIHQEYKAALTDLGVVGMEMVLAGHICDDLCRALGLPASRVPGHYARSAAFTHVNTATDLSAEERRRAGAVSSRYVHAIAEEDERFVDLSDLFPFL